MVSKSIAPFVEIPATNISLAARKPVFGVGINDADYITDYRPKGKSRIRCQYYVTWISMLTRCYSEKFLDRRPTYVGCTVAKEWHSFMNFRRWMERQDWMNKELDKDLLIIGNKIYSPETCIFISPLINRLIADESKKRKYPTGVYVNTDQGKEFFSSIMVNGKPKRLGCFATQEEARNTYKTAKAAEITKVAILQSDIGIKDGLIRHAEHLLNG